MPGTSVNNKNKNFKKTQIPAHRVFVSLRIFFRQIFELKRKATQISESSR